MTALAPDPERVLEAYATAMRLVASPQLVARFQAAVAEEREARRGPVARITDLLRPCGSASGRPAGVRTMPALRFQSVVLALLTVMALGAVVGGTGAMVVSVLDERGQTTGPPRPEPPAPPVPVVGPVSSALPAPSVAPVRPVPSALPVPVVGPVSSALPLPSALPVPSVAPVSPVAGVPSPSPAPSTRPGDRSDAVRVRALAQRAPARARRAAREDRSPHRRPIAIRPCRLIGKPAVSIAWRCPL